MKPSLLSNTAYKQWAYVHCLILSIIPIFCHLSADVTATPSGRLTQVDFPALRRAIDDLSQTYGPSYPKGAQFLKRLSEIKTLANDNVNIEDAFETLQREALQDHPLLDFEELLVVKRPDSAPVLGLPRNWQGNCELPVSGYDDAILRWSWKHEGKPLDPVFKPGEKFVGDVDLHWDDERVLFSMRGPKGRWQVYEKYLSTPEAPRQLTGEQPDVDSYDACYLPNGRIAFTSTASFVGVPCVNGSAHVANLYIMDGDGSNIRQLCFDQEHNWCPTVMNDGRILYARWEYTGTPHSNTRLLFTMNPDGTSQFAYLGGSSYWPNSFFYARPIPGHPSKVVAVIGGHHDHPRMGELVLFDPQLGRREGQPVVQRIPGFGEKVEPVISDGLTLESWPKFLHPWPLDEKNFLVSCKPSSKAAWGIYLADVFDNLVLLKETPGFALMEPIPLRQTKRPPVIPERVNTERDDALVVLQNIYEGDGLKGVPVGSVKSLRIFAYHYAYQGMGGLLGVVGMDGPWDVKRILGTVPVEPDGSARFHVPANMPISLQPLDSQSRAIQLMRSWTTAMPGETLQCTGCHDRRNMAPPAKISQAMKNLPSEITPWYGPARGFSYAREVQPVIDQHCVSCHNGQKGESVAHIPDLRGTELIEDWDSVTPGNGGYTKTAGKFSVGYAALHRYVRRPGIESEFHVLEPMEFHADTTQLVQLLRKGHHGVELSSEAWDRLITWIDLNCPFHGTWGEAIASPGGQRDRRRELLKKYANLSDDPEKVPNVASLKSVGDARPEHKTKAPVSRKIPHVQDWPFTKVEAKQLQSKSGSKWFSQVKLAPQLAMDMALIPSGDFAMGSVEGAADELPVSAVKINQAFWMSRHEITNEQFAAFDPLHDSRIEDKNAYQFGIHGYPSNEPHQPVVRVTWQEAMAFCHWLSSKTGRRFTLPTEAQWEWACRAGASTPFHYGNLDTDFSQHANFADSKLTEFASDPYTVDTPLLQPTPYDDWIPKDDRFNDHALIAIAPGNFDANAWGLFDMHGNVAEWTRSSYLPYPWVKDNRNAEEATGRKVARGGSWRDKPTRGTASFRLGYESWQRVYNVGFRVICEEDMDVAKTTLNENELAPEI
jgi:formylglycine-generating enzyme required for sulfatase activity